MNQDYDAVVCAALLHDIGKFLHSGCRHSEPYHKASQRFVSENSVSFADPGLTSFLVGGQHRSVEASSGFSGTSDHARHRMLARLVDAACAASTPRSDGEVDDRPLGPMRSVFSQVDIGAGIGKACQHRLSVLFDGDTYPDLCGSTDVHGERKYQEHSDRFLAEFRSLFLSPHDRMADSLVYLLQKYLWCVPSDVAEGLSDISLAEHMKVSAAFAACQYKWHEAEGWTEAAITDSECPKSLLLCGDISGIQSFIYGIANVGTGGIAKRLRGRSFRISMLTDAIALRILYALDLPLACRIMSAGGQFYLLIPNTADARSKVDDAVRDISGWLLKSFNGEIALSTGRCEVAADDLAHKGVSEVLLMVRSELALQKQRKFADVVGTDRAVLPLDYRRRQACAVCGRRPADPDTDGFTECDDCHADRELGQRLVSEKAWLVFSEHRDSGSVPLFENPIWYASLVEDQQRVSPLSPIAAFNLRGAELVPGVPSGYQLHAGYVPRWRDSDELEAQPGSLPDKAELKERPEAVARSRVIKSFEALACSSEGVNLLGVLRADVDHLGLIFTLGLEQRASLSRIATMSSMLHHFFTYELQRILEMEYPDTYTAYAGGDDLMLVGPWNKMIELANRISEEFRRFTADNPNITISAGIGTYKPKAPIATTSRQTGELLERSKAAGRNRLTVFDTTIEWGGFKSVCEWKDSLCAALSGEDESRRLSRGFLYKLLEYQRQARDYESGNEQAVMYRPHLAYDVGRNMTDKDGNPLISADLHERLCLLIAPESRETWRLLKAPITWCTYLLRKE